MIALLIEVTSQSVENPNIEDYLKLFFNISNPIYIAVITSFLLFAVIYIFLKYAIIPLIRKHEREKHELELKSARLTALFAELDPDPVIRTDMNGKIIGCNQIAENLFGSELKERELSDIVNDFILDPRKAIQESRVIEKVKKFGDRYFKITFNGFSELEIGQIYFNDITKNIEYEKELEESRKRYKDLSIHLDDKLEEERARIARELHDSVGQKVVSLKMSAGNIIHGDTEHAKMISTSLDDISNELRDIAFSLKPKLLEEAGLEHALKIFVSKISESSGLTGDCSISGLEERLDPNLELTLFRVAQEGVQNVIKHSKADKFGIQLVKSKNNLRIFITDNGMGFDANDKSIRGMGLFNMEERIGKFNGELKIISEHDEGTILIAEIPTKKNER